MNKLQWPPIQISIYFVVKIRYFSPISTVRKIHTLKQNETEAGRTVRNFHSLNHNNTEAGIALKFICATAVQHLQMCVCVCVCVDHIMGWDGFIMFVRYTCPAYRGGGYDIARGFR